MIAQLEEWRAVPSQPWLEASSLGRFRVLPYTTPMGRGGNQRIVGKARVGCWDGSRYTVTFRRCGTLRVARLVCEAFHGPAPEGRPYCLHGDEDARNNRPDNLSWGTQKQNLNAPGFLAYCRGRIGDNSPAAKARRIA